MSDRPVDQLRIAFFGSSLASSSLADLAAQRDAIEGFHVDENEYHLGLVTDGGERKPAFHAFRSLLARGTGEGRPRRPAP